MVKNVQLGIYIGIVRSLKLHLNWHNLRMLPKFRVTFHYTLVISTEFEWLVNARSITGNKQNWFENKNNNNIINKADTFFGLASPERGGATGGEENVHPTRESIIERLLRFFRSRPSMESLKERGIYKPEPVFGSTLSEITAHEKSTVPKFIVEVTRLIETKGLEADGLYRV